MLKKSFPDIYTKELPKNIRTANIDGVGSYDMFTDTYTLNERIFNSMGEPTPDYSREILLENAAHELLHKNDGVLEQLLDRACRMGSLCGYFHRIHDATSTEMAEKIMEEFLEAWNKSITTSCPK